MFIQKNKNPLHKRDGDCAIRAISEALEQDWDTTFLGVVLEAFKEKDMPSGNHVWSEYLRHNGFTRHIVENVQTVEEFADDHPDGTYILALDGHVVCVKDGNYVDTWDSGHEIPIYYFSKN